MQLFSILAATALLYSGASARSRFHIRELHTPLSGPCDLTTGPDGALWGQTFLNNLIFRIDPDTHHLEEYSIPYKRAPIIAVNPGNLKSIVNNRTAFACVIQPGEDGNLYAATGIRNEFARINPTTKKVTVFDTGNTIEDQLGDLEPFNDAYRGPDGMYFTQTTANKLTRFDYTTHKFKSFTPPTPESGPLGVYYASDGAIWFTELLGQKIARFNITTHEIKEYPVPLSLATPSVMRAETKMNGRRYLWFTAIGAGAMGRIDMDSGAVKAYPFQIPLSAPSEDTVDKYGNVWFSTINADSINRLNPKTGKIKIIPQPGTLVPAPGGFPPAVDVAIHYGPGNRIWFTELAKNKVGYYQLD